MFPHSILLGDDPSERQFVDDLTSLCKRHNISCGNHQDITHLGADLASNDSFRADLFERCIAETGLSSEQLLILVVRAFGGSETSIRDITIDLPQDVMSAFLDGYKTPKRELDPEINPRSRADRDPEPAPARPGPTLFYSAAAYRSAADPQTTRNDPPASRATSDAPSRRHIPANATLESLTLSELRMYLEDIENRVSRLEPQLAWIAPQKFSSPERFEQSEALEAHPVPEATSIAAASYSDPAVVPETLVLPALPAPALDVTTPSSLAVLDQNAIVSDIPSFIADTVRLRRLRIVNAVLTSLLILVCGSAAIFGYRYLRPQPAPVTNATHQSTRSLEEQPSKAGPANQTTKALKHAPSPSTASSTPASAYHPGNTTPGSPLDTHPVQASPTQATTTPAPVIPLTPQTTLKSPEPSPTQAAETPASQQSNPPNTVSPTPSPSVPQPDRNSAEPEHSSPPADIRPLVSSATVAPTSPINTSAPASIPKSARPTNAPVVVPAAMMMTYAVFTPKPVYPSFRHIGVDSAIDVEVTISKDGKVISTRALNGGMDVRGAAIRAVQAWRFTPFILDGNPVAVVTTFRFVFRAH